MIGDARNRPLEPGPIGLTMAVYPLGYRFSVY